jgi:hypothetical protein
MDHPHPRGRVRPSAAFSSSRHLQLRPLSRKGKGIVFPFLPSSDIWFYPFFLAGQFLDFSELYNLHTSVSSLCVRSSDSMHLQFPSFCSIDASFVSLSFLYLMVWLFLDV